MSLDEDTCLECDNYYCYDYTGNCTDNYYVISEEQKYYFRCNVLNEIGTGCEKCDYELNETRNGLCYDDVHCEIFNDQGECIKCQKDNPHGFFSYCLNKDFGCIDTFLNNCIRCDDNSDLDICTQCEDGYEANRFGECIGIE